MRKYYRIVFPLFVVGLILSTACKKEPSKPSSIGPIAKIGLYEYSDSIYKRVYIAVSKVGTQTVNYGLVFDTGSAGMTIDAANILPASMITSTGLTVPGDSVNVNGITVTNQQGLISFGNAQGETQEFGNLAYAPITIGDANGSVTTRRIPIFLYYKIYNVATGKNDSTHTQDVFGVGPGISAANSAIMSPLSYFNPTNGAINGFKLALFNNSEFSTGTPTYVGGLLTIGLVPDDISSSSPFVMHPLNYNSQGGYSPDILSTVTYSGKSVSAYVLFDTGTPAINIIANSAATSNSIILPTNTTVTLTTGAGFTYTYKTGSSNYITQVSKPSYTNDPRTIFSIDFFSDNEFLTDYRDHAIGLKNN